MIVKPTGHITTLPESPGWIGWRPSGQKGLNVPVPAPVFHLRHHGSHNALFDRIPSAFTATCPSPPDSPLHLHSKGGGNTVLAARAFGIDFGIDCLCGPDGEGPVSDAVEYQVPVLSPDLWSDDRWPRLTRDSVGSRCCTGQHLDQVHGWPPYRASGGTTRPSYCPAR